jgi:hypothetical protein
MSKKIARGSLYALGMAILTAQAAEPPLRWIKGKAARYYRLAGLYRARPDG